MWPARPGASRGALLLLNGRNEYIEKYEETAEDFRRRGFAVWTMDWRGQGLSREPAPGSGPPPDVDYAGCMADLDLLVEQASRVDGPPVATFAHSMGGLIALRHAALRPGQQRPMILSAPLFDLLPGTLPRWLARAGAGLAARRGRRQAYALGQRDFDPRGAPMRFRLTTSDPVRFARGEKILAERPELRLGGITWGWVEASFAACRHLHALAEAGRIGLPLMIASAGRERLVSNRAHRRIAAAVPGAVLHHYPESRHELLMERDEIRNAFWRDIDAFLERHGV